jgi:hypothetical protein
MTDHSTKQQASKILFGDSAWLDRPDMAEQMDDEFIMDDDAGVRKISPNQLIAELDADEPAKELATLREEVSKCWETLDGHGFPPEACGWPFKSIVGELPNAIDCAIDCLFRQREALQKELATLREEVSKCWETLDGHGFPPEACGWPFKSIVGELPNAIDCALDCLFRQREALQAEVEKLRAPDWKQDQAETSRLAGKEQS